MSEATANPKAVDVKYTVPDDLSTGPAQLIIVQHTAHEFVLSFFEVRPPIVVGSAEQRREIINRVEEVDALCVARVTIAAGRMPEMLRALQDNLHKWEAAHGEPHEEGGNHDSSD